jgi:hypothetical protein
VRLWPEEDYPQVSEPSSTALMKTRRKRKGILLWSKRERLLYITIQLIILANKENMLKIPSAYKLYRTIWLYNTVPHWGTALFADYYLSFLCHIDSISFRDTTL